jgi:hypothetical protein
VCHDLFHTRAKTKQHKSWRVEECSGDGFVGTLAVNDSSRQFWSDKATPFLRMVNDGHQKNNLLNCKTQMSEFSICGRAPSLVSDDVLHRPFVFESPFYSKQIVSLI